MEELPKVGLIVFGGTGDLAKRKLIVAFKKLVESGVISKDSYFLGIGRTKYNSKTYKISLINFQKKESAKKFERLRVYYFSADATKKESLAELPSILSKIEKNQNYERIFYLATNFSLFSEILKSIKQNNLDVSNSKFAFEKPFGKDLETHDIFERQISSQLKTNQTYRVDHYLGKETISNLHTLIFMNPLIEGLLNKDNLSSIEIIANEKLLVGRRINYYNEYGAVKDMIQSHLLQILSILIMNKPLDFSAKSIHREKEKALKSIYVKNSKNQVFGQYSGYLNELKEYNLVDNKIETFTKVTLYSKFNSLKNVPIHIQTGKGLLRKETKIKLNLKNNNSDYLNTIEINIQPKQDLDIFFNICRNNNCEVVNLNFSHDKLFGKTNIDGYEKILSDMIKGNNLLFTSVEENRLSWMIVEQIQKIKKEIVYYDVGINPLYLTTYPE